MTGRSIKGRGSRRPNDGQGTAKGESLDRRQQIIEAAARVMGRQGFAHTSLKQIAQEVGIAPALIHYYFKNKEQLLVAVIEDIDLQFRDIWRSRFRGTPDPMERMLVGVEQIATLYRERPEFWSLQFDLIALSRSNPALREPTSRLVNNFIESVQQEAEALKDILPASDFSVIPTEDQAALTAATNFGILFIWILTGRDPLPVLRTWLILLLSALSLGDVLAGKEPPLQHIMALLQRFDEIEPYRGPP